MCKVWKVLTGSLIRFSILYLCCHSIHFNTSSCQRKRKNRTLVLTLDIYSGSFNQRMIRMVVEFFVVLEEEDRTSQNLTRKLFVMIKFTRCENQRTRCPADDRTEQNRTEQNSSKRGRKKTMKLQTENEMWVGMTRGLPDFRKQNPRKNSRKRTIVHWPVRFVTGQIMTGQRLIGDRMGIVQPGYCYGRPSAVNDAS